MRSSRALLAAPLAALVLLPGCILPGATEPAGVATALDNLSPERFGALAGTSVWIEASSDSTPLHVRLFQPDAPEDWDRPVILVMSPYFGADAREDPNDPASRPKLPAYAWLLDTFVPRGYTVAFQDVRGTGDSGGCLEQTAQMQWQDGFDVVEWLGSQNWSNGKVGTFGRSYAAEAQQGAALLAPPHLVTMVPVASVSGQYEYGFFDGVPFSSVAYLTLPDDRLANSVPVETDVPLAIFPRSFASNLGYATHDGLQPPDSPQGRAAYASRAGCHPEMLQEGLDVSGDWNEFWEAREFRGRAGAIEASVLYVHGLQDWNVKPVAIRDWFDRIPSEKRAIFGQWAHDYPDANSFQPAWSRADWRDTVHRWFDHWLLEIDNGILDDLPPVQVQDSDGVWRSEATYPPTDAASFSLHLGEGTLSTRPVAAGLAMRENQEAFAAAATSQPIPTVPPPVAPPNDVLVFESEPLARALHVSGFPTLTMNFTVTDTATGRTDPHFAFVLYDVAPDGEAKWINRGYLSARHRDGVDAPAPVPVGEAIEYRVRFFPQETVVAAGHTLRLTFAGSDEWTLPENSFWAGTLVDARLDLPAIEREWDRVTLDVEFGERVDAYTAMKSPEPGP